MLDECLGLAKMEKMTSSTITKSYLISAPIEKVWQALVDPTIIHQWSDAPAKMTETVGGEFELWDGDITGTNTTVEKPNRLVQEWQSGDWDKPSSVSILLQPTDDHTEVSLVQTGHPESEQKDLEEGWDSYYFGAIEKYFEAKP